MLNDRERTHGVGQMALLDKILVAVVSNLFPRANHEGPQIAPGEEGTFKPNGVRTPHPHSACSQRPPPKGCCSDLRPPPPPWCFCFYTATPPRGCCCGVQKSENGGLKGLLVVLEMDF